MPKLKCVTHKKRVFINPDTHSVRHRENLAECGSARFDVGYMTGLTIGQVITPENAEVWRVVPGVPEEL